MGFIKRAFLYVVRKRGKTILLFSILLIMATFVLTGLSIWKASEVTQLNLRKSLGAKIEAVVNWSDKNPYIVNEKVEVGQEDGEKDSYAFLTYSTKQFTIENVNEIKNIEGVKYCNASTSTLIQFENISLIPGSIPVEEKYQKQTKIMGVWETQDQELFTSGTLTLVEGHHITSKDSNKVIISKDLSERNELKIGDFITTKSTTDKEIKLQIVGIFNVNIPEDPTVLVTIYDKIENRIFGNLDTVVDIEDSPAIKGFSVINITVDDPKNTDRIVNDIKNLSSIEWEAFNINVDNATYLKAVQPLTTLNELIFTLLIVIIVVSAIILALILTLWTKSRIHEIGIFLSIGIKKFAIIGQYLIEVLLIAIIAFAFSFFTSNAIAEQIGNHLLSQSVQSDSEEVNKKFEQDKASSVEFGAETIIQKPVVDNSIKVSVGFNSLIQLYLIGFSVIIIAVGISSITVMRLKPREILSKMS